MARSSGGRPSPALLAGLWVAAGASAAVLPALWQGHALVGDGTDLVSLVTPHYDYIARRLSSLELPLWNPYVLTGAPELAGAQWGVLYPLQLLGLPLLGARAWILVSTVIHLALVAAFGARLASRVGTPPGAGQNGGRSDAAGDAQVDGAGHPEAQIGAMLAGLALAGSGFVVSHLGVGHLQLLQALPWILALGSEGLGVLRRLPWAAPRAAGALALVVLAGGPQLLPYGLLAVAPVWFGERWPLGAWARLAATLFAGLALAGPQLLPSLELTADSARAAADAGALASGYGLQPAHALGLVLPGAAARLHPSGWEVDGFVGGAVLVLALLGSRGRGGGALWAGAAVAAVLGAEALVPATSQLPVLSLLRVPGRAVLAVVVPLCLLASRGVATLPGRAAPWALAAAAAAALAAWDAPLRGALLALSAGLLAANGTRRFAPVPAAVATALGLFGALRTAPTDRPAFTEEMGASFAALAPAQRVVAGLDQAWNLGMRDGFLNAGAYEPFAPLRSALMVRSLAGIDPRAPWTDLFVIWPYGVPPPSPLLAHAGVGRVLGGGEPGGQRAAVVGCAERVGGPVEALLRLPGLPPPVALIESDAAVVASNRAGAAGAAPCDAGGSVRWELDAPESQRLAVDSAGGWLVVSDLYTPDWHATVDGEGVAVLPANAFGRAVALPPGRHTVTFDYRPQSPWVGAALAGVSALLLLGLERRRATR